MYTLYSSKFLSCAIIFSAALGLSNAPLANAQQEPIRPAVSVKNIELYDSSRERPVMLTVWYPTGALCENAEICLSDKTRTDQAAIISHGAMGAAKNYNWLGYAFASQGIVTVGVNHYGESWAYGKETINPESVVNFKQRPLDVRFSLDQLSANGKYNAMSQLFSNNVDWNNTIGVGHSSGGATVLALAGAQFDFSLASAYCKNNKNAQDKSCAYQPKGNTIKLPPDSSNISLVDDRIKRVITLDPALGHVSKADSLEIIGIKTLVIGAKNNDFLPYQQHAGRYAQLIDNATSISLDNGEGHFVFLDPCSHQYQAAGVSLCVDSQGVDRASVHKQLYPAIFEFIFRP